MFEKDAEEIANKKLCATTMCYGHCSFSSPKHHRCGDWHRCYEIAKEGAEFGYNKAKEETEYARTIIQALLDNSDEYARQRAYEFLDRPCATCRHKAKMLTDKKPCKDCDNGWNWG